MSPRIIRIAAAAAAALAGAVTIAGAGATLAAPRFHDAKAAPRSSKVLQTIAQVEGVTPAVLLQDLNQGRTLLQIANGKYADADSLATALLTTTKARLDVATSTGTITAAQESVIYTTLLVRTTTLVTVTHPLQSLLQSDTQKVHATLALLLAAVATSCTTTPTALTTLLRAGGTTVLAACQRTNPQVTQAALTAAIFAPIQAKLHVATEKGLITAVRESTLDALVQAAIGRAITTTLPARTTNNG